MDKNILQVAMEVILHAGDGRNYIDKALDEAVKLNFDAADGLLEQADSEIVKAHTAQTQVIQSQVAGEDVEYSLLFIHAQDTIMTIQTELRMATKMIELAKAVYTADRQK